jgi:uncharacterized protein YneF (UPF0154 family)
MIKLGFFRSFIYALLVVILTLCNVILPHGFGAQTMISLVPDAGYMPIEHMINFIHHKKHSLASYNADAREFVVSRLKAVSAHQVHQYCIITFCSPAQEITCAPDQQFYNNSEIWVAAYNLKPGDVLLCDDNACCKVASIRLLNESMKVYSIEVQDSHTFLVGTQRLVTHNTLIALITMTGICTPFVTGCGATIGAPLGPVGICSGIILGGAIGYFIKTLIKEKIADNPFAFNINKQKVRSQHNNSNKQPKDNKKDPKKPRNTDFYANMYEVFEKAAIGKTLKECSEGTKFAYDYTSKIFRVIKDIKEYSIKCGDWFYLDKMHGDHIEVFNSTGKAIRAVLNMDGTQNIKKLDLAAGRRIVRWIT